MGKIAFVFAGQGAQYSGMGRELCEEVPQAREIFQMADDYRQGTSQMCFSGTDEELKMTSNTQPCIYCVDLSAAMALEAAGVHADLVAGFSLGEVAALAFSGAFSPEEGFRMVCERGALMQEASEEEDSSMAAVLRLEDQVVEDICRRYEQVYPVNYNCPKQVVVAGLRREMQDFSEAVKAEGGRALPLAVSGGFHSPFMASAARRFQNHLRNYTFSKANIPVYSNYTAQVYSPDVDALLFRQVQNPVRWQETIENMIADGADRFIEVGPGKTLSGLISKISGDVQVFHVEDRASLEETVRAVKNYA